MNRILFVHNMDLSMHRMTDLVILGKGFLIISHAGGFETCHRR